MIFVIRSQGKNHKLLLFRSIRAMLDSMCTQATYTNPETPPTFLMMLRKYLGWRNPGND